VDFFRHQEDARRKTRWLMCAFAAGIVIVVSALDLVVFWTIGKSHPLRSFAAHPGLGVAITLPVLAVILGASVKKWSALRGGGAAVARALGGVRVDRGETDFARRQLLNVVEEMAIAAHIRPPQVFVISEQPGINAFAAGHSVDDAAITVTGGALTALSRDELQAVIGHELSHVLNGDMRLNLRLIAWLHGLFFVTVLAQRLMWADRGRRQRRTFLVGLAVFAVGSTGLLVGRLLQAAVSRKREQLADASSVQFTRNPAALKQALLKIAGHAAGSAVVSPAALEVAHLFFAAGESSGWSTLKARVFATHPPIGERIKALDPSFDPRSLTRLARLAVQSERAARSPVAPPEKARPPLGAAGGLVDSYRPNARAGKRPSSP